MKYRRKYFKAELAYPPDMDRTGIKGIKPNPEGWTEQGIIRRDIHHGFLKHRAQAKFRGEHYELTLEQWQDLWTLDRWMQRGKTGDSLVLTQIEPGEGWTISNVMLTTRKELNKNRPSARK